MGRDHHGGVFCMQILSSDETVNEQAVVNYYFEKVASYWAEVYERDNDLHALIYQERLQILLELVGKIALPRQARVMEVGCGAGYATVALARLGYFIDAIDATRVMVDSTRNRAINSGLQSRVRSSLGDVRELPFPDETFGLVVAMGVLSWLPSMAKAMQEMCRVLQPEGYLILGVENRWGLRQFLDPFENPLLGPVKELARRVLRPSEREVPRVRSRSSSIRAYDAMLDAHHLEKLEGVTFGFGPLTLFGWELLPHPMGLKVHRGLQALAHRSIPVVRSIGALYTVLGRKSGSASLGTEKAASVKY
jgi:ubiquinone/menaquinone biosynthesis C-methylase UbiE